MFLVEPSTPFLLGPQLRYLGMSDCDEVVGQRALKADSDNSQPSCFLFSHLLKAHSFLLAVALEPVPEPNEELGSVIPCRKHLAEQRQITGPVSFSYRRYTVAEEAGLLHELPERRNRLPSTVRVAIGDCVPQLLLGGVRPQSSELVEEGVGLFDPISRKHFRLYQNSTRVTRDSPSQPLLAQTSCIQSLRDTMVSAVSS